MMRRWNNKGSIHAKQRMAELRLTKLNRCRSELIDQWAAATGRTARDWYAAAREHLTPASTPMDPAERTSECIAWLKSAIEAA